MRTISSSIALGCLLAAATLPGCAGTAQVLTTADQQSLAALPLFAPDGTPRFSFELSCSGEFVSCNTLRHGFERWADERHIHMQMVDSVTVVPRADASAATPYRVAISITPLVIASYNKIDVWRDKLSGQYTPPKVSYRAVLHVFDAASGHQLSDMEIHDDRVADYKADANIALRAELKTLISGLDPSYRSP